jgi:hypothetical protein
VLLSLGYVGSRSLHLVNVERNMNTVVPVNTGAGWIYPAGAKVLNPNFGPINTTDTWNADSTYESMHASVKKSLSRGLQLQGSYTWAKSLDNASSTSSVAAGSGYPNAIGVPTPLIPGLNRGLSDFDLRHVFVLSFLYDVPTPNNWLRPAKLVLGGWQLGGIYKAQTGFPFTVMLNSDRAGSKADTTAGGLGQRPNLVLSPECKTLTNPGNPNNYVKTGCFTFPAAGVLGNLARNSLTAPGISNLDFSLVKNAKIAEFLKAQFRAEFFNGLNHANFSAPAFVIFDSSGKLTSNVGVITSTTTAARQIQFGLKLIW